MNNAAIVVKLSNVRKHPNADRLQLASALGYTVIVGTEIKSGDIGLYFPDGTRIGYEFAVANNLIRKKDEAGNNIGGLFEENRRVKTVKLRGEKSEGFWIPIGSLKSFGDVSGLKVGETFHIFSGKEICIKYEVITRVARPNSKPESIMMPKHMDTEHLRTYINNIGIGELLILTSKSHGTSFRVAKVLKNNQKWWQKLLRIPNNVWEVAHGSRNVVLGDKCDQIRLNVRNFFDPMLRKGEAIYGEIVGFDPMPIMPVCQNAVLGKEFVKTYGASTTWTYGCAPGTWRVLVYRITTCNEDGFITELSWEQVKERCKELGVDHVYEFEKLIYDGDQDRLLEHIDKLSQGPDPLDHSHIKEGVVVRIERAKPKFVKHKSFEFKVLEGIVEPPQEE